MDDKTKLILYMTKSTQGHIQWRDIAFALSELYGYGVSFMDAFHYIHDTFKEVQSDARYKCKVDYEDVMLSPIRGYYAIDQPNIDLLSECQVEQFYSSMISSMLSGIRLSVVSWSDEYDEYVKSEGYRRYVKLPK